MSRKTRRTAPPTPGRGPAYVQYARRDEGRNPRQAPPGCTGLPIDTINGVTGEVLAAGTDGPDSFMFPLPDTADEWAIVQTGGCGRWMVGLNGWTPDEWPSREQAIAAVCNPWTRAVIAKRAEHFARRRVIAQQLAELDAAEPDLPEGAIATYGSRFYQR